MPSPSSQTAFSVQWPLIEANMEISSEDLLERIQAAEGVIRAAVAAG